MIYYRLQDACSRSLAQKQAIISTRKLSYRKDDRAMCPRRMGALKIFESLHEYAYG